VTTIALQEESIAPVTILDGQGSVVRIVAAAEFRRLHPIAGDSGHARGAPRAATGRATRPDLEPAGSVA
jgi:hypothetical protein